MVKVKPSWIKDVCSAVGFGLSLPSGAIVSTLAGGLLQVILPGVGGFLGAVLGQVAIHVIRRAGDSLGAQVTAHEKSRINHDLQTAFRDACRAALYDLGGERCFPQVWKDKPRDVPPAVIYPLAPEADRLWRENDPLADQVKGCFEELLQALDDQRMLPLDPPPDQVAADVRRYLEAETPEALADAFHEQVLVPQLAAFSTLRQALPGLEAHLHRYTLDRLLVHLGEFLKDRDRAWRAYNRLVLEGVRNQVREVAEGQDEVMARLDALLAQPEAQPLGDWASNMADLLSATGQIEKRLDEGLDSLAERVVAQHADVVARLEGVLAVSMRIESKVDRVLRILEDGQYVIEGAPAIAVDEPPAPGEPPFKGLRYFDQADAELFFGREVLTAQLVGRLRFSATPAEDEQTRLLAIVGASGSGKSSLLRAGLLPALVRGEPLADGSLPPAGSAQWVVRIITPTAHPLEALASSLTCDLGSVGATSALVEDLRDPRSLNLAVRQTLSRVGASHLLLVVDQFEELFTLCRDEAERRAFVDGLLTAVAAQTGGALTGVIALRADFYAPCAQFALLRTALEKHQAYIGPMSAEELRRAVEEPARRGGWLFERGLVEVILDDVGDEPGALPLLSHALLETWQRRRGRIMTLESYAESGGVHRAIAKTAETVFYQHLSSGQQAIARSVFLRLIEMEESQGAGFPAYTRRRATLSELVPRAEDAPAVEEVLRTLTDARLVTTGEGTVDVAHEALIREWPTLRRWLDENRAGLRLHRRLTEAAQEWQRFSRDEGLLYRGARLAEAGEWVATGAPEAHGTPLNDLEREFLAASQALATREEVEREAQRQNELEAARRVAQAEKQRAEEQALASQRLRRRAVFLAAALGVAALFLVAAIAAAGTARVASGRAEQQAQNALSRQLAAQARNHVSDLDLAVLLSLEANRLAPSPEVKGSLLSSLVSSPHLALYLHGHTAWVWSVAFSPDGRTLASASRDGTIILWDVATHSMRGKPLDAGKGPVFSVAFSPDGQTLAAGHDDGTIVLWDLLTSQPRGQPLLGHSDRVWGLAYSPDGATLASGSRDSSILLWDVRANSPGSRALVGHREAVRSVAFSPDGKTLASGSDDGSIILWAVETGQALGQPIRGYSASTTNDDIASVAFSPDGRVLASASWDGMIVLWDLATRQPRVSPMRNIDPIPCLAFSPDGQTLASGGVDATIRLWDVATGQSLGQPLAGHSGWVNSVAFSPDGQILASASADHTVILWSVHAHQSPERVIPGHPAPIFSVAFSPDGQTLAAGGLDRDIVLSDVATGQPKGRPFSSFIRDPLRDGVNSIAFNPDGRTLAGAGYDRIVLWDTATRQPRGQPLVGHEGWVDSVAFSPDGSYLASGGSDNNVVLWKIASGQPVSQTLQGLPDAVYSVAISPDGNRLALGTAGGVITVWDLGNRRLLRQLVLHQGSVNGLAFSPDSKLLVSASSDATIVLWDMTSLNPVGQLKGHTGPVNGVAFSPDGRMLASGSNDKTVILWDVATRQPYGQPLAGHSDYIVSVAFSPDGKTLASSSFDGSIRLWEVPGGKPIGQPLRGHTDRVWGIAFSPDGRILASASSDRSIILWDVITGKPVGQRLEGYEMPVAGVAFSPDGRTLASTSFDNTIVLWDLASGQRLGDPMDQAGVWQVAWTPDSKLLASAGEDGTALLWDVSTHRPLGDPLGIYTSHSAAVTDVSFSPDGQYLASASLDGTVILWDMATGKPLGQPLSGHNGPVRSVAFSPDGKLLASGAGDGAIIFWDAATGKPIGEPVSAHEGVVMSVRFSPDSRMLASGSCGGFDPNTGYCTRGEIRLWDVVTHQQVGEPLADFGGIVFSVAFSPDGQTLAGGSWDGQVILWDLATRRRRGVPLVARGSDVFGVAFSADGQRLASAGETQEVSLWDVANGQALPPLIGNSTIVASVAFSPFSQTLASGSVDGTIILWDLATGRPRVNPLLGHSQSVASVAFSPDGRILASASCGKVDVGRCIQGEIRLWDAATGQPYGQPLIGHTDFINKIAFSPDGKMLASASSDHTVLLWDVASRKPLDPPLVGHDLIVFGVAFSPDGRTLASCGQDGMVILWDVATRRQRGQPLIGHTDSVFSIAFSPDGAILASASADHSIILWDVATGQPIAPLSDYSEWVSGIAFSPDGQTLASGGSDGDIVLWDISSESWQTRACNLVQRNLTRSEWSQYLPGQPYRATCPQWPSGENASP